ncbi:MAG: beta-galactosidase [Sphingobacteriaceae bacterium]
MLRNILSLLCLLTASSLFTHAQTKKNSPAKLPILAWYGIEPRETTVARFEEMRATGINHSFSNYPDADAMQKALDIAQKTGIKMIVACPELATEPEKTVKRFMNHPAVAGYFLRDEPTKTDFKGLADWAKRIRAVDDKHFCYLNLLPNYASNDQLGFKTYREYVNAFDKEVPLQLLSFDHYPVIGDSSRDIRENWYENLEIFADEAAKVNKPFWAFALTVAHTPYPVPTMAALRLQVYSNLAYGAQGIQYFTYWTPVATQWNFHNGPITPDGKRTEVYDKITAMNKEINGLSAVFLAAKVRSIAHTGETIPQGTRRLTQLPEPVKLLETEGNGAVVSVLENGANTFLVIVNRDLVNTMKLKTTFAANVKKVLKDGSAVPADVYDHTITVDAGDVAIYKWPKK